jgi:hypothetical protein
MPLFTPWPPLVTPCHPYLSLPRSFAHRCLDDNPLLSLRSSLLHREWFSSEFLPSSFFVFPSIFFFYIFFCFSSSVSFFLFSSPHLVLPTASSFLFFIYSFKFITNHLKFSLWRLRSHLPQQRSPAPKPTITAVLGSVWANRSVH